MSGQKKKAATRGTKPAPSAFARAVAAEIRSEMGRQNISKAALVRMTGLGRSNTYAYVDGTKTMDLDQLRTIAVSLGTDPGELVSAALGSLDRAVSERASLTASDGSEVADQDHGPRPARSGGSLRDVVTRSDAEPSRAPSPEELQRIAEGEVRKLLDAERVKPRRRTGE